MNLRMAMCEALVDGWHGDWKMTRVIYHAWRLADATPENEVVRYTAAAEAVKSKSLHGADRAQTWIARNMRNLNESLWAGRKRDACIACAQKTLGVHKSRPLQVKARERDTRTDWGTVK